MTRMSSAEYEADFRFLILRSTLPEEEAVERIFAPLDWVPPIVPALGRVLAELLALLQVLERRF